MLLVGFDAYFAGLAFLERIEIAIPEPLTAKQRRRLKNTVELLSLVLGISRLH